MIVKVGEELTSLISIFSSSLVQTSFLPFNLPVIGLSQVIAMQDFKSGLVISD